MKIAVVHDWLVNFAGAEQVLQHILELYPQADLFAVIDFLGPEERKRLLNKKAKTTFLQRLPFVKRLYPYYLFLMPLAIEQLDLSSYDLIISSNHAVAKGVIPHPDQVHLCYCHSPLRYAWDLQGDYFRQLSPFKRVVAASLLKRMREWDVISSNRVDHFAANSHFVARRIEKCYRREAEVIPSGIDLDLFPIGEQKENFYLTVSRLVPYKRIDLIVRAFAKTPKRRLVVIGDGPELKRLRRLATYNVQILGYLPHEETLSYMQRARGFVFAAKEDQGRAPIEAQCCGTPVIAYAKGGGAESLTMHTGVLFHEQSVESIIAAIEEFESETFSPEVCQENGANYSMERFKREFAAFVDSKIEDLDESSRVSWRERDPALAYLP